MFILWVRSLATKNYDVLVKAGKLLQLKSWFTGNCVSGYPITDYSLLTSPAGCSRDAISDDFWLKRRVHCQVGWASTEHGWNSWHLLCQHLWPKCPVWECWHAPEGECTQLHMLDKDRTTRRWDSYHQSAGSQLWWEPERTWEWTRQCVLARYVEL